jgi:uridine kinase
MVTVTECSVWRRDVLVAIAAQVPATTGADAVRVAVDGVDGSGKSVFADQLAGVLREQARPVVRASVDGFHHPRVQRYRRGRSSPSGFWLDSFDYDRLRHDLLDPLGPGGSRRYRTAVHDLDTDRPLNLPWVVGSPGVVLVLDGLFLHRDELYDLWELSVFLDVPFDVTAARMAARDGSNPDPHHPSMSRYIDAQRTYFTSCSPATRADLVVDNSDWDRPALQDDR